MSRRMKAPLIRVSAKAKTVEKKGSFWGSQEVKKLSCLTLGDWTNAGLGKFLVINVHVMRLPSFIVSEVSRYFVHTKDSTNLNLRR